MPAILIKGTDKVMFKPEHNGEDIVELSNYPDVDEVIRQEDIPAIGTYTHNDGTTQAKNKQEVMFAGLANDFDGDVIMKAKKKRFSPLNARGHRVDTHFTRNKSIIVGEEE